MYITVFEPLNTTVPAPLSNFHLLADRADMFNWVRDRLIETAPSYVIINGRLTTLAEVPSVVETILDKDDEQEIIFLDNTREFSRLRFQRR